MFWDDVERGAFFPVRQSDRAGWIHGDRSSNEECQMSKKEIVFTADGVRPGANWDEEEQFQNSLLSMVIVYLLVFVGGLLCGYCWCLNQIS